MKKFKEFYRRAVNPETGDEWLDAWIHSSFLVQNITDPDGKIYRELITAALDRGWTYAEGVKQAQRKVVFRGSWGMCYIMYDQFMGRTRIG